MEPCDVGPVGEGECRVVSAQSPDDPSGAIPLHSTKRHHPNGIEPPDEERDRRAQRRAAERNLMDFYDSLPTYISACDAMKPIEGDITQHVEAGETFARLIGNE